MSLEIRRLINRYYDILWSEEDIDNLREVLSQAIEFNFQSGGNFRASSTFTNVMKGEYVPWSVKAKRSGTEIHHYSIKYISNDVVRVEYEIDQELLDENKQWIKYKIKAEETLKIIDEGNFKKIGANSLRHIYMIPI